MKNKVILGLSLIFLIVLSGCQGNHNKILSSKMPTYIGKDFPAPASNGPSYVGSGFTSTPKKELEKLSNKKDRGAHNRYPVETDKPFKGSFFIDNHDKKREYAVLALLDYKQVPLALDGKNKWLHYITMGQNEKHVFSMKTEPIGKGMHDFMILSFFSPNNHSLDQRVRETSEFAFNSGRANLVAQSNRPPTFKFSKNRSYPNKDFEGIMLNFSKDPRVFESSKQVKRAQEFNYSIHIGNASKSNQRYAIMAFLDYNQIPTNKEPTIFVEVKPKQRIRLRANLKTPSKKGIHELLIIAIANPFIKVSELSEKKKIDTFAYSTNRIALKVQ